MVNTSGQDSTIDYDTLKSQDKRSSERRINARCK